MTQENQKKILISVHEDEIRVALTTNQQLNDFYIEQTRNERNVGNIYLARVVKVQYAFQAAFVDYGAERHGFLPLADVAPQLLPNGAGGGNYRIQDALKPGQILCVQVVKDEIGQKGAALTTNVVLPGRFLVFMPYGEKGGISRKIDDPEQRQRLQDLLDGLVHEEGAVIVRTAGIDRSLTDLKKDFLTLRRKWNKVQDAFKQQKNPGLIYEEEDVVVRRLRDYFTDDVEEVWIDDPEAFHRGLEFFRANIPTRQKRLRLYVGDHPLFSIHGIEEQIEALSSNRVRLPSGGSIVIDQTEALVAIDVNSGRSAQENGIEETALRTNVEAAREVARQLRLRNLGGLIVIDFIDMNSPRNRDTVTQMLHDQLQSDKARWSLGTISQFGLLEMSRQRIASTLLTEIKTVCPTCGGSGHMLSITSLANGVLRKVRELAASGVVSEIHGRLPLELNNYLVNRKRDGITQIEMEFDIRVFLLADVSVALGKLPEFQVQRKGESVLVNASSLKEESDETKSEQRDFRPRSNNKRPRRSRFEGSDYSEKETVVSPEKSSSVEEEPSAESAKGSPSEDHSINDSFVSVSHPPERHEEKENHRTESFSRPRRSEKVSRDDTAPPLNEEPALFAAPPPSNMTVFSSVHHPHPEVDDAPWIPPSKRPLREQKDRIPIGSIVYSSVHRILDSESALEESLTDEISLAKEVVIPNIPAKKDLELPLHQDVLVALPEAKEKVMAPVAPVENKVAELTPEASALLVSAFKDAVEEKVEAFLAAKHSGSGQGSMRNRKPRVPQKSFQMPLDSMEPSVASKQRVPSAAKIIPPTTSTEEVVAAKTESQEQSVSVDTGDIEGTVMPQKKRRSSYHRTNNRRPSTKEPTVEA